MPKGFSIRFDDVSKNFGAAQVLRDLSFEVAPGEIVAIVGRSGSGKSTALRLVSGLDRPSAGQVLVDGRPVKGVDPRVRYLFQDPRLLPWRKPLANVAIGRTAGSTKTAAEMLERVGLNHRTDSWPASLSGGERQRVALARALVGDPSVLLLDEPFSALDALTRIEMQTLVESLWEEEGFSAILVTHDVPEAVTLADRVIVLGDGEIRKEVRIDIPRPRVLAEARQEYVNDILAEILHLDTPTADAA